MCYEIVERAKKYKDQVAVHSEGEAWKYGLIVNRAQHFATLLLGQKEDLAEARVAFMVNPGVDYVSVQWAIWIAGGIAVPLCLTYPPRSLDYVIQDTAADLIVASDEYLPLLEPLSQGKRPFRLFSISEMMQSRMFPEKSLPVLDLSRKAMILYTSGTTNLPKGVVTTHANIKAQIEMLQKAWKWESEDRTLCVLPLHHVHGIINVVCCSLWAGAICIFFSRFEPEEVVELLEIPSLSVFMAVPTIYYKLITYIEGLSDRRADEIRGNLLKKRLMVSGSAALPVSVMEKWYNISGHWLLERYGMTEIGMAISNPYRRGKRKPGFVGLPLPTVDIRLVAEDGKETTDEPGEIQVKGPAVFQEYWRKKEATEESFTEDGWFKTGDTAVLLDGYYKILGRADDRINVNGYKLDPLNIENMLFEKLPNLEECAVFGRDSVKCVYVGPYTKQQVKKILCSINKHSNPKKLEKLQSIPKNTAGKISRTFLNQLF